MAQETSLGFRRDRAPSARDPTGVPPLGGRHVSASVGTELPLHEDVEGLRATRARHVSASVGTELPLHTQRISKLLGLLQQSRLPSGPSSLCTCTVHKEVFCRLCLGFRRDRAPSAPVLLSMNDSGHFRTGLRAVPFCRSLGRVEQLILRVICVLIPSGTAALAVMPKLASLVPFAELAAHVAGQRALGSL